MCFYSHQESNTGDRPHLVAIRKKRTLDQNQKKLNKNRRESQWLTETTDGTLKTAPHTLQLISDNEQKDVGKL